nr:lantibiotic dehydratase [Cytobacillus citreus]
MLRTPLLPLENFIKQAEQLSKHDNDNYDEEVDRLISLLELPEIKESIAISSLSLYKAINKKDKSKKQKEQIISSVFKYINRMSTRSTPFGLLSGISIGEFNEKTDLKLNHIHKHMKRARPDMQWLLKVVKNMEQDIQIVRQLYVTANKMIYQVGNRIKLPFLTNYGDVSNNNVSFYYSSVDWNELVEITLSIAATPIKLDDLNKHLQSKYDQVDMKIIESFTYNLFINEFLISSLRPPLADDNAFEYVLKEMKSIKGLEQLNLYLHNINELINQYNSIPIGKGLDQYIEICEAMREIADVKNPLQVDLRVNYISNSLHKDIKNEITKVANVLWKLSPQTVWFKHLNKYHEQFLEKYGIAREVPILELLDEDIGLGAPHTYENPISIYPFEDNYQEEVIYSRKMMSIAEEAIIKGNEVRLTDEIIHDLMIPIENDYREHPESMELYFTVNQKNSQDKEEQYQLIMGPNAGSPSAGKSFGRFLDILDRDVTNRFKKEKQKQFQPDGPIVAEIVYLPRHSRAANVALTKNLGDYQIVLGTSSSNLANELTLDDLVVGCTMNRLYIKSKTFNREVIPVTNHMLNITNGTPNVYRFMCEIGMARYKNWRGFTWGLLSNLPYLPRIIYSNTILSLATWNINHKIIKFNKNQSDNDWFDEIARWRKLYKVPRYVYLTDVDNRIMFDLENKLHLLELKNEFTKILADEYITLTEIGTDFTDLIVRDEQQRMYNMECVFPLVLASKEEASKNIISQQEKDAMKVYSSLDSRSGEFNRTYYPGSEWMYFKVYGIKSRIEEFIAVHLSQFIHEQKGKGVFDTYFFMRYADPLPHIRIRFKGEPEILTGTLLPLFNNWMKLLREKGVVTHCSIDTYDREAERYGGPKLIGLAEKVFSEDSNFVLNAINFSSVEKRSLSLEDIGIISTIDYLSHFLPDFDHQLEWLNNVTDFKKYSKEFRENRSLYMKIGNDTDEWSTLRTTEDGELIYQYLKTRSKVIEEYVQEMALTNDIYNSQGSIMGSFIHLNLNRLIGIDRLKEEKVMTLCRHTLYNLRFLKKQKGLKIHVEV